MGSRFGIYAHFFLWCFLSISHWFSGFTSGADRIRTGQLIGDGDTLVSAGRKFALGFFSPKGSGFRYVGIWFHGIGTRIESVVWVANREAPIFGAGGVLTIGDDGMLILKNGGNRVVWSSKGAAVSRNSTAVMTDAGNLELQATGNRTAVLWQSFDDPTDTYLPDMKVHFTAQDGEKRVFTSWRAGADPSPGNYTMGVDPRGAPQIVLWEGPKRRWRSGHWNGLQFTGVPGVRAMYLYGFRLLHEPDGRLYFMYMLSNPSDVIRFRLSWEGVERQERWIADEQNWKLIQAHPVDECDGYNRCGAFGKCNEVEVPKCSCMQGFVPQDGDRCVRRTELQCEEDGFEVLENVKLPDFVDYVGIEDTEACEKLCRQNCSCSAYAFVSGINCMIWSGDLVDVQQFVEGGSSLHIRIARSDLTSGRHVTRIVAAVAVSLGTLLGLGVIWLLFSCHEVVSRNTATPKVGPSGDIPTDCLESCNRLAVEGQQAATGTELAMFSFNCMAAATDNFSDKNKLGQGGFGLVYKGMLPGAQAIAVKRLSKRSGQGLEEFKNEITLIAKLQHRNLVRLLGCCTEGDERMLLYEYMPNNSLDSSLFDPEKRSQLDWSTRFNIIEGIARGLLYLHRDSRLRIIHRDLKASNILLDEDMNPKISDFGMAKIFGGNQNEITSTNRVVGTFGYMAPEYAMEGLFSLKSDVYSFGVLLLEIITGQKNTSFRTTEYLNIIGYAWDRWEGGRAMELLDPLIPQPCPEEWQVLRCLHVGMLCVQDMTSHRPDMQSVVVMLESESALPAPRQPTLVSGRHNLDIGNQDGASSNNVTVTVILGR